MLGLPGWGALGRVIYFTYSRPRSHVGRGLFEADPDDPPFHGVKL